MQHIDLVEKQLEATRLSLTVIRNHTTITNSQPSAYSVGCHIGGVIQMLLLFYPNSSKNLVRQMAFHDYLEIETGDVVGAAKVKYPELGKVLEKIEADLDEKEYKILCDYPLTATEKYVHDLIDRAELLFWCFEQYQTGCRAPRFLKMMKRVHEKVMKLVDQIGDYEGKETGSYEFDLAHGTFNLRLVIERKIDELAKINGVSPL